MAIPSKGASAFLRIRDEAVYGTDPGAGVNEDDVKIVSGGMTPGGEIFPADRGLGNMAPTDPQNKAKRSDADYIFDLRYTGFELLLWHFFGSVAGPVVVDTSANQWTFLPDDARTGAGDEVGPGGLTVIQNNPVTADAPETDADAYKVTGVIPTDATFRITNETMEMSMPLLGQAHVTDAAQTSPAFPTDPVVLGLGPCDGSSGVQMRFREHPINRVADTPAFTVIDGFSEAVVSLGIPYDNSREFLGCEDMQQPLLDGPMTVTVELTREHAGDLFTKFWRDNTQIELSWIYKSKVIIGATTQVHELELVVSQCLVTNAGPTIADNGVNEETISLEGFWDESWLDNSEVSRNAFLRLINTRAAIPTP